MPRRFLTACALLLAGTSPAVACEGGVRVTLDQPAALEGVLKAGKGNHEAQGPFDYIYLELDKPVCVDAPPAAPGDEDAPQSIDTPVSRVQIAGEASAKELPIGSRVWVEGTLFSAHTMWHVEDVLIDAAELRPK